MKSIFHKFELKPRPGHEERTSVGANMQLFMDGKPLQGVKKVKLTVEAGKVANMDITFVGKFDSHALASYFPIQIAKKRKKKNAR